ncbi:PucR family transcriptional regulator [Saccharopolyspora karakumensis]|uniref:PucR family transcriptional regulator n=1 Tax=Saccharopolyspora karakumensis TaxID=2530386 RepID=A0A4R5C1B5_9PSEU|nr:helix-turn-helix domain-containing protein [Saccharopolyspora karakumensis]TDD90564.1 PucR family transcriptional regulator [Saccharopolyspora karakumensis]
MAVEEQVPVYRQWRELGHGDELASAIEDVITEFAHLVRTDEHEQGRRVLYIAGERARQGLPANAILGAWRVAGHELWRWLTEEFSEEFGPGGDGIELWSRYLAYADHYVEQITDTFFAASQEERVHAAMIMRSKVDRLVRGAPPEETEQTLRDLGVLHREVVVVLCRLPDAGPDASAELVADYSRLLQTLRLVTRTDVPWTMVTGSLLALVPVPEGREVLVTSSLPAGSPLRVGISRVLPARSDLSVGRDQAERALHATTEQHPVNNLGRMSVLQVAAMQARLEWADLPEWVRTLLSSRHAVEWTETGRALMEQGGNVSGAAKALSVHTNTVYYRLETIRSATGVDLRDPQALAELELAALSRELGVLAVPGE